MGERPADRDNGNAAGRGGTFTFRPWASPEELRKRIMADQPLIAVAPSPSAAIFAAKGIEVRLLSATTTGRSVLVIGRGEPRLLRRLSVRDNLLFVTSQAGEDMYALLESLAMRSLGDSAAGSLSKGQAQRAALIRALIVRPGILLLDEALRGLDPRCWQLARDLILRRRRDDAFTLVEIKPRPGTPDQPR